MSSGFDPEAVIDAMAPMLGLTIDPAHRPGIVQNLRAAEAAMRRMTAAPLDDMAEPAPVFRPEALR
jgi:hypothetical protein